MHGGAAAVEGQGACSCWQGSDGRFSSQDCPCSCPTPSQPCSSDACCSSRASHRSQLHHQRSSSVLPTHPAPRPRLHPCPCPCCCAQGAAGGADRGLQQPAGDGAELRWPKCAPGHAHVCQWRRASRPRSAVSFMCCAVCGAVRARSDVWISGDLGDVTAVYIP
jgi:hypothetical protein